MKKEMIRSDQSEEAGQPGYPPTTPEAGIPITYTEDEGRCHCQGHRLAIVIGPRKNPSIKEALAWLKTLTHVQHKLFFDVQTVDGDQPAFDKPQYFDGDKIKVFPVPKNKDPVQEFLATQCKDCCHWDEVAVVCRGGQHHIWYALLTGSPRLLGNRPVRKFVLWMCKSAREFCPDHPETIEGTKSGSGVKIAHANLFEQIAWILQPKSCSVPARCDCNHSNCNCFNADGNQVPPHCPDGTEAVKLVCGAWYPVRMQDGTTIIHRAAALGLRQDQNGNYELTSPDGKVREVTVSPSGDVTTADPTPSNAVFAGTKVVKDESLRDDRDDTTEGNISVHKRMKATKIEAPNPDPTPPYNGPKVCNDAAHDGCQHDAV